MSPGVPINTKANMVRYARVRSFTHIYTQPNDSHSIITKRVLIYEHHTVQHEQDNSIYILNIVSKFLDLTLTPTTLTLSLTHLYTNSLIPTLPVDLSLARSLDPTNFLSRCSISLSHLKQTFEHSTCKGIPKHTELRVCIFVCWCMCKRQRVRASPECASHIN